MPDFRYVKCSSLTLQGMHEYVKVGQGCLEHLFKKSYAERIHPSDTCSYRISNFDSAWVSKQRIECLPKFVNIYQRCGRRFQNNYWLEMIILIIKSDSSPQGQSFRCVPNLKYSPSYILHMHRFPSYAYQKRYTTVIRRKKVFLTSIHYQIYRGILESSVIQFRIL